MADHNGDQGGTRPPLTIDLAPDAPREADATPRESLALPAAAAAVGGVLGLVLSLIFAGLGVWPAAAPADTAETVRLRTELAAARADTEKLTARLNDIAAARPQPAPAPQDGRVAALAEKLAAQEKLLAELQARPAPAAGTPAPAMPDPRLDQFGADIAALRQATQPVAGLPERLAKLEAGLADLTAAGDAVKPLPEAVATLDGRFGRLETTTTDLQRQTATLADRVGDVTAKLGEATAARGEAVLALSLASLKTAVDAGRPFQAELAVAERLLPGAALRPLDKLAAKGVVPVARLAETFPGLARRIGEAELAKRAAGGTLVDRLLAQARQSVSIRPVDEAAGPSMPARLARIEAALNAGKPAEALTDWQALPEAARALDPKFDAELAARADVDALLASTTRTALDRLAGRAP
jgi:hypothetical protein